MKAILIVIVIVANGWGGGKSETTRIEFDSMDKCQKAAQQLKNEYRSSFPRPDINAYCIDA